MTIIVNPLFWYYFSNVNIVLDNGFKKGAKMHGLDYSGNRSSQYMYCNNNNNINCFTLSLYGQVKLGALIPGFTLSLYGQVKLGALIPGFTLIGKLSKLPYSDGYAVIDEAYSYEIIVIYFFGK